MKGPHPELFDTISKAIWKIRSKQIRTSARAACGVRGCGGGDFNYHGFGGARESGCGGDAEGDGREAHCGEQCGKDPDNVDR